MIGFSKFSYSPVVKNSAGVAARDVEKGEAANLSSDRKQSVLLEKVDYIKSLVKSDRGFDVDLWRTRYLCLICCLYATLLGPWSGWQAACNSLNEVKYEITAVMSLLYFLSSLILAANPSCRWLARSWILMGICWLISSWLKYYFREFGEDLETWKEICIIETGVWCLSALLPATVTDPATIWLLDKAF